MKVETVRLRILEKRKLVIQFELQGLDQLLMFVAIYFFTPSVCFSADKQEHRPRSFLWWSRRRKTDEPPQREKRRCVAFKSKNLLLLFVSLTAAGEIFGTLLEKETKQNKPRFFMFESRPVFSPLYLCLHSKNKTKHDTPLTLSRWRGAGGRGAKSVPGSTRGRRARAAGGGAEAGGQPGLESLSDLLAVCGRSPGLLHPHVAAPHARSGIRRALRQWSCDEPARASLAPPLSCCVKPRWRGLHETDN